METSKWERERENLTRYICMCVIIQENVSSEMDNKLNSFTIGLAIARALGWYKGSHREPKRKKGVTIGHRKN